MSTWAESRWDKLNPYAWVQTWHRKFYPYLFERHEFPVDIIVVGSVHVGGAGKTPFTMALVDTYLKKGKKVGVLSRGYGRTSGNTPLWVCEGKGPLVTVFDSGDEPWMLAFRYPQAFVVCASSRREGVELLMDRDVDVIICDDGFQHLSLKASEYIVLLPSLPEPRDTRILPFGKLRENLRAIELADEVWVEKSSKEEWTKVLKGREIEVPRLLTYTRQWKSFQKNGEPYSLKSFQKELGKDKVHLFCGLGRPGHFVAQWEKQMKLEFELHRYRDHELIPEEDLEVIEGPLVMTEKDWVKLAANLNTSNESRWWERCWVIRDEIILERN